MVVRFRSRRLRAIQRWSARHPYLDSAVFVPLALLNLLVWTDWSVPVAAAVGFAIWFVLFLPLVTWRQATRRNLEPPVG